MNGDLGGTAALLRRRCGFVPEIALVLGSGLSPLADGLEEAVTIPYAELLGLPVSTAPGHRSEMVAGRLAGTRVLALRGRFHRYEGYSMEQIIAPVRLLNQLGCERLLLTNAAGGVNTELSPGDFMLIGDHINLSGVSPLRGPADEFLGPRFGDLSGCWSRELRQTMCEAALNLGIPLSEGVYCWTSGPSFETPAEIRMARFVGGDAVGMSTVPEAIAASQYGIQTVGISLISNLAAGILDQPITAQEVMETGRRAREELSRLVTEFVRLSHEANK